MRLRIHIEFIGLGEIKITKFSGNVTIKIEDMQNRLFDFDSFKLVDRRNATDFCLGIWDGDGYSARRHRQCNGFRVEYSSRLASGRRADLPQ